MYQIARKRTLLALLGTTIAFPGALSAQAATSGERNITIGYQSGSATQNGYADAQLRAAYRFQDCAEGVGLVIRAEQPHMLVYPHRYWVDGQLVQVPAEIAAPTLSNGPTIRGTVNGRGLSKTIAHQWTRIGGSPNCWNDGTIVAPHLEVWERGATTAQKTAALQQLGFHPSGQLPPLQNSRVEAHFRAIWRQAREDSIARVRGEERARAEREREERAAAERRAEEERRAEAERRAAAEAARQANPHAAGASSSGSANTGRPMTPEEAHRAEIARHQEAARRAEEERIAEEARQAEEARRVLAELERQRAEGARRQKERDDAIVNAATSAAQTAVGLGIGFGPYLFNMSGTPSSKSFEGLQGYGLGFDVGFMYLDVGMVSGTYSDTFIDDYESDGYSTLDPAAEGFFSNAGVMLMIGGDAASFGFSGGLMTVFTTQALTNTPVFGMGARFGGLKLRLDLGLSHNPSVGGGVYFNFGR